MCAAVGVESTATASGSPSNFSLARAPTGENDTILSSAEIYSPVAGKWRPCCPLNLARSNLALLPLCD